MMCAVRREQGSASELEQLGDELIRRGMRTTLAPDRDDVPSLDAIRPVPTGVWLTVAGRRITWRGAAFWMVTTAFPGGEDIGADVGRAADLVSASLQWTRQLGIAHPRGTPET